MNDSELNPEQELAHLEERNVAEEAVSMDTQSRLTLEEDGQLVPEPEAQQETEAALSTEFDVGQLEDEVSKMQAEIQAILQNEKLKPEQRQLLEGALRLANQEVNQLLSEYQSLEGVWGMVHKLSFIVNAACVFLGGVSMVAALSSPDTLSQLWTGFGAMSASGMTLLFQTMRYGYLMDTPVRSRGVIKKAHQRLEETLAKWEEGPLPALTQKRLSSI